MPFTATHRAQSASSLALGGALTPLKIKPVDRTMLPKPARIPTPPPLPKVLSMAELAPDVPERRTRRETQSNVRESSIASIAFSQV